MNRNRENTHSISILVNNKPGVLVRVAQVFARRGYNIDSLVVSPAFDPKFSRMTITAQGDPEILDQIIKQCFKLVDVLHADEHTKLDAISRELALLKIKNTPEAMKYIEEKGEKYKLKIVKETPEIIIVQQSGKTKDLDDFEDDIDSDLVLEMVRSGKLVMTKTIDET